MQQHLEHELGVGADTFWETFLLDETFERDLYEHLKLRVEHKQLEREGSGSDLVIRREMHVVPDRQVPAALTRLLRGATMVKEKGVFQARERRMDIEVELPVIGRITEFNGRYSWGPAEPQRMVRAWDAVCRVRVPLVGSQIEKYLLGEVAHSLQQAHEFCKTWFASH